MLSNPAGAKSLNNTIESLRRCPNMAICIHFCPKTTMVVIECRSVDTGAVLTNPVAIKEGDRSMLAIDVVDFEANKLLAQAKRQNISGPN